MGRKHAPSRPTANPKPGGLAAGKPRDFHQSAPNRLAQVWLDDGDGTKETGPQPDDSLVAWYRYDGLNRRIVKLLPHGGPDLDPTFWDRTDYYYGDGRQVLEEQFETPQRPRPHCVWCPRNYSRPRPSSRSAWFSLEALTPVTTRHPKSNVLSVTRLGNGSPSVFLFMILTSIMYPHLCAADHFHSSTGGYHLDLPAGWQQIPKSEIDQAIASFRKPGAAKIDYDAGFQLESASRWLDYPYVLVISIPYGRGRPSEKDFGLFVEVLTGMDADKLLDRSLSQQGRQLLKTMEFEKPQLDVTNRRFLWTVNMNVAEVGPVRALMVGNFGQNAMVQVAFYSPAADWDRYKDAVWAIVESFRFDPDKAYDAASSGASTSSRIQAFLNGERLVFSTKDHPKAKGINLRISHPKGWIASEGERPNIVQKFLRKPEGTPAILESLVLTTKRLPIPVGTTLSIQDQKDLFSSPVREMLPPGATLISSETTAIDAIPAVIMEFTQEGEQVGTKVFMHAWAICFLSDHVLVMASFYVCGALGEEAAILRRATELKPLFKLIANSIVLPDQWVDQPEVPVASSRWPSSEGPSSGEGTMNGNQVVLWILGAIIVAALLALVIAYLRRSNSQSRNRLQ